MGQMMLVKDLRPLIEPDLTRKGLKWDDIAYVEFYPDYYTVTHFIRDFDGKWKINPLDDFPYVGTTNFKYKESDNGMVEYQGVPEQPSEEASLGQHVAWTAYERDRASRDGDAPGSAGEGPRDGREAQAGAQAPSEEAEACRGWPCRGCSYCTIPNDFTLCGPLDQCNVLGVCYNHL